eukprot:763987-Hanusia_phi.AAC.2
MAGKAGAFDENPMSNSARDVFDVEGYVQGKLEVPFEAVASFSILFATHDERDNSCLILLSLPSNNKKTTMSTQRNSQRLPSNKSPEISDGFDSDDSDDGDLIVKVREKLKDQRKKTADDAFFVNLLSKYSTAVAPADESDRDLPFWGPGIHFSFNQISRELRVSAVLDPPHGPGLPRQSVADSVSELAGPRSGIVRGDVVVRTSKTNVDYSQEPRTIFQEMLGEYGTKILVTFVRTSNVSYKFDVLLTRSYFNEQIVSSSMSNHGVLAITFVTGRNFQWDGPSACRICALDGACQDPLVTEFASHDEQENARWNSNVYVPITDFKAQTITITVFSKSIVNSAATTDKATLKLRVPTLVSGWNEATDHWFNLHPLGQEPVLPSFSGFGDDEEQTLPQVRLKLNWTSVAKIEDLNLAVHNAKIKDRTRLERSRTLRAAAADSKRNHAAHLRLLPASQREATCAAPSQRSCKDPSHAGRGRAHAPACGLYERDPGSSGHGESDPRAGSEPCHGESVPTRVLILINSPAAARQPGTDAPASRCVLLLHSCPAHLVTTLPACQNVGPTSADTTSPLSDAETGNILQLVRLIVGISPESVAIEDCDGLLPLDFAVHNPHKDAYKAVVDLLSAKKDLSFAEVPPVCSSRIILSPCPPLPLSSSPLVLLAKFRSPRLFIFDCSAPPPHS